MPWNATVYNQFKEERCQPFYDLIKLVQVKPNLTVIDLGCGTGELTGKLADALPGSFVTGIDSSLQMLLEAGKLANGQVIFQQQTIEEFLESPIKWNIIFSNAALHWVNGHASLFPRLIAMLQPGGQLAVQMPSNHTHLTHTLIQSIAAAEPFKTALSGFSLQSPVLTISQYAEILFTHGGQNITIFEKAYPHVLPDAAALVKWTQGTVLVPYMERLDANMQDVFLKEYTRQIEGHFPGKPVFYPFKRILLHAVF